MELDLDLYWGKLGPLFFKKKKKDCKYKFWPPHAIILRINKLNDLKAL